MNSNYTRVSVMAPATSANLAVGFDILGMSVGHLFDRVTVNKIADKKVVIKKISGDSGKLPLDANKNTASMPLLAMIKELKLDFGFELEIEKGIPLSSGLGGSAASAVAAVVAANQLLPSPLSIARQIDFAMQGEALASGVKHADNIAPCLMGGAVLCLGEEQYVPLPWPQDLFYLLIHPAQELQTSKARAALPQAIPLALVTRQSRHLAGVLSGLFTQDTAMLLEHMQDLYVRPARAPLIDAWSELDQLCHAHHTQLHISGAGPSMITFARDEQVLRQLQDRISSSHSLAPFGLTLMAGCGAASGAHVVARE